MKDIELVPSEMGLHYDDIYVDTDDGIRLNAWFIPREDAKFTLLFCHGNAGNISHRIEKALILNKLGLNIFMFDYRGYGRSTGRPSEPGFYKDAQTAYNFLVSEKKISPHNIILYGESLGGAVAIDLAGKKDVKALITECTFSSVKDVSRAVYPILPTFFIFSKFDSISKIKDINIPKLIIHSQNDEIIPFSQSVKLFKISPEPKRHLVLKGSHNTCFLDAKDLYVSGIRDFLNDL
ncbi:MAG: alpha/beta hydrolase [Candidatus Omnitrophica bacterium]|nr:alpha/beta hydrolase [Candidatus Omnitrophota bacterium]